MMEELARWIKENIGDEVTIVTPQFERTEELDFNYIPKTEEDFNAVLGNAPWDILKGMGFRKWDTMNNVIKENVQKSEARTVGIPVINGPPMKVNIGRERNHPVTSLDKDRDILLFPGEWFNSIPEGFIVTGLNGDEYPFYKSLADDDIRFGGLPYGFQREATP